MSFGLAVVLVFVGIKMLLIDINKIPIEWSLVFIALKITGSVFLSLKIKRTKQVIIMMLLESNFWNYLFDAHHIIEFGGLFLILAIIYIETGFFLGFVLPGGDYMLFAAGIFCGTHYLDIPLFWLVVLLIAASFLGDSTGYFKGKWLGQKLFADNKSRFFKKEYLERGSGFYTRFGIWAFILGRFMPIIRTLVPMIAGASGYSLRKFLLFNFLGAITWVGALVPLGYFIGKTYPEVIKYSFYILLLFIAIASFPMFKIMFSKVKKP